MKFYSYVTWNTHKRDLKNIRGISEKKRICINFVSQVASGFSREYWRIGVLSFNDLIQEGYLALLESWEKIDWKIYNDLPEEEKQPFIWNFIKQGIKWRLSDSIKKNRSTIRIPEQFYTESHSNKYQIDVFLVQNFSWFFNQDTYLNITDAEPTRWEVEELNEDINYICDKYLTSWEKTVLYLNYGIDGYYEKSMALNDIADKFSVSPGSVRKTKQRALEKLRQHEEVKTIYDKFYS